MSLAVEGGGGGTDGGTGAGGGVGRRGRGAESFYDKSHKTMNRAPWQRPTSPTAHREPPHPRSARSNFKSVKNDSTTITLAAAWASSGQLPWWRRSWWRRLWNGPCRLQGSPSRPARPNRRTPVPVYRSGLAGYRSEPVKFKFEFKLPSSTGSYRYTGRFDRYTGRFGW